MQRSLLIIIPYWHGASTLPACLDSIAQSVLPDSLRITVLIVHNGGDMATIPGGLPYDVVVLRTLENIGFARAVNVGLDYGFRHSVVFMMLLNQDTVMARDALRHLLREADESPGIYSPMILDYQMTGTPQWYASKYYAHIDFNTSSARYALNTLSATCVIASTQSFINAGFFDPEFYMYYEDDDYFARFRKKGGNLFVVPYAKVGHMGGSTETLQGNSAFRKRTGVLKYLIRHRSTGTFFVRLVRHYGSCIKRLDVRRFVRYLKDDISTVGRRSYLIHATDEQINANARTQIARDTRTAPLETD